MTHTRRVALVTGGNRGIGLEIARQLAHAGLRVVIGARDVAAGRQAAAALGAHADAIGLDVTSPRDRAAAVEHFADGLDILVDNAGIALDGFDSAVVRRTLDTNFYGAMHVTDALLPAMRSGGRIVMVSSRMGQVDCLSKALGARVLAPTLARADLLGFVESFARAVERGTHERDGWPSSAYRVSKVAMNALTRILARELADDPRALCVNAACPGWVRTSMGGSSAPVSVQDGAKTPVWLASLPPGGPTGGFFADEQPVAW